MGRDTVLSRDQVESLIAEGGHIVIYHGKVLRLNSWISRHPGGDKSVYHMVGRDASDEMDVYHGEDTLKSVGAWQIGTVEVPWKNFLPPIQGGKFRTSEEIKRQVCDLDEGVCLPSRSSSQTYSAPTTPPLNAKALPDYGTVEEKIIESFDRKLVEIDIAKYPSLDVQTQMNIDDKFHQLHEKLQREGFFQCNYWGYVREASRISTLLVFSFIFFRWRENSWTYLTLSAICLGLAWHQITFIVHDAGHLGITHNYQIDNVVGVLLADFVGGLSVGWWKRNHNVHHLVTNDPIHDPDIQHLPFFAVSSKLLGNVHSSFYDRVLKYDAFAKVLIRVQHYSYYFILCFGRFNLYRLSWEYLILGLGPKKGKGAWLRYFELTGMAVFSYWFFYLVCTKSLHTAGQRWLYIMVSHVTTMPLHVQITLSHFSMSTSDLGLVESFPQKQLRTTMDVDCPAWLDYIHGGLQFQAIHHLFPRMPRHNFRKAQPLIRKFSKEVGVEYCIYGFTAGNKEVISKLRDVAKQAKIMADCVNHLQEWPSL